MRQLRGLPSDGQRKVSAMNLVDQAVVEPGCCLFCRTSKGPLVDTGRYDALDHLRIYFCTICVASMAQVAGLPSVQAIAALVEEQERNERALQDLIEGAKALIAVVDEAEAIRAAFAFTAERGWVIDRKEEKIRPRQMPGTPAIDWAKKLDVEELRRRFTEACADQGLVA